MEFLLGGKHEFTATVGRTSVRRGEPEGFSICLHDITYKGEIVKDHAWVRKSRKYPKKGTKISFTAKVVEYKSLDENYNYVMKTGLREVRSIKNAGK